MSKQSNDGTVESNEHVVPKMVRHMVNQIAELDAEVIEIKLKYSRTLKFVKDFYSEVMIDQSCGYRRLLTYYAKRAGKLLQSLGESDSE